MSSGGKEVCQIPNTVDLLFLVLLITYFETDESLTQFTHWSGENIYCESYGHL